ERGLYQYEAEAFACQAITYASFRFTAHVTSWPGSDPIGNHTKFVMIDDDAFYIGSHNLYPANLQEFGTIIADPAATDQLKAEYWDRLWEESSPEAYACPY
ncbi:MAG: hypothetical protein EOP07_15180, partial [Proteobacteria bacterium]